LWRAELSKERIIVALDVDTEEKAAELVGKLAGEVGAFKVGLELFNVGGPRVFLNLKAAGAGRIFYDAKLHDIPNTVAGAARAAARMGIWMLNLHCSGGSAMMKAGAEAARDEASKLGIEPPKVVGVTVLTSMDTMALADELRVASGLVSQVVHLAKLAKSSGLDGVVASPQEIRYIREACGPDFLIVTPGVRPAGTDSGDQKRVATPAEAASAGADYLVIGRPIIRADDPVAAARAIAEEIDR
jgi:orotidine-5'-phosphate decarboxylase